MSNYGFIWLLSIPVIKFQVLLEMEVCPVCEEDFPGWSTQKTLPHLKCHQDQENLCVICGERFTSQVEQYLHCKRVHIEQMEN